MDAVHDADPAGRPAVTRPGGHGGGRRGRREPWQIFRFITLPHLRQYLELGGLLGSIYIVQTFDAVFVITSGGLGTANLPYTIYQTFFSAHDYGLASAQGVVVVIGSLIIATFALRVVSSLFARRRLMTDRSGRGVRSTAPTRRPVARSGHGDALLGSSPGDRRALRHPGVLDGPDLVPQRGRRQHQPAGIAAPLTLDGYRHFFGQGTGTSPWPYLANSITASVLSTLLVLALAIPAAYALSIRPVRKWTDVLFFFLSTKMLPLVAGLLPIYLFAQKLTCSTTSSC